MGHPKDLSASFFGGSDSPKGERCHVPHGWIELNWLGCQFDLIVVDRVGFSAQVQSSKDEMLLERLVQQSEGPPGPQSATLVTSTGATIPIQFDALNVEGGTLEGEFADHSDHNELKLSIMLDQLAERLPLSSIEKHESAHVQIESTNPGEVTSKRKNFRRFLPRVLGSSALAVAAFGALIVAQSSIPKPPIVSRDVTFASELIQIRANQPGRVDDITVAAGQSIEPGSPLATLSKPIEDSEINGIESDIDLTEQLIRNQNTQLKQQSAALREARRWLDQEVELKEASVETAKAELVQIKKKIERLQPLIRNRTISRDESEELEDELELATRRVEEKSSELGLAKLGASAVDEELLFVGEQVLSIPLLRSRLAENELKLKSLRAKRDLAATKTSTWQIRSTCRGTVESIAADVGDRLETGSVLLTIRTIDAQQAEVRFDAESASDLRVGSKVDVFWPRLERKRNATVTSIDRGLKDKAVVGLEIQPLGQPALGQIRGNENVEVQWHR